ncbi:hypothetical protein AB0C77_29220 [Streptomyces sp. NPDC048629]|uniref:hypothetical protein n=1 Tax=Streptomyces sp. NPDC048629 TaxID=3154824 RepID=UPI00343EE9EF
MPSLVRFRRSRRRFGPLAALGVAFAGQVAGAVGPDARVLAASTAAGLALEVMLNRRHRRLSRVLSKARADVMVRQLIRDLLLVAGLMNLEPHGPGMPYLPLCYGLLLCYALYFACQGAVAKVRRSRTLPVLTRNIDASALRLRPAPPALLTRHPGVRLIGSGLPATAGLVAAALTGDGRWAGGGVALSVLLAGTGLAVLLAWLLPGRRPAGEAEVLAWFDAWLAEYRPTVGMYFSGGTSSAYQANMWLEPLAALGGRPVIVLRERFMMQKIGATDLPVICVPKVAHLMRLEHSTLGVLIHPANSGKTSQVLRIPTIKHAFVNHGESDKLSSCNPYAKAYDEVWVAGPAARERYALAEVGVDDRDVVEIGRPQLTPILPYSGPPAGRPVTVLYAPTWEGWTDDPGNTSVILAGENLVRALLADPGVRLLYKPHPMTGSVDPRAAAADARIRRLVQDAAGPAAGEETAARRPAKERRAFPARADGAERMLLQGVPEPGRASAHAAGEAAWDEAYWAALGPREHRVVTGARPALYSCFNRADLLISDVSSVVSDFLASGKPYAVANTGGLSEDEFRAVFPTVRAATVLTPDGRGVPALLEAVRDPSKDRLVAVRAELKEQLLGPADPPSPVRFAAAVEALARRAAARGARTAVPAPRTATEPDAAARRDRT